MSIITIRQSTIPAWMRSYKGKYWYDMPGSDEFVRKCNFYLFRKGLVAYTDLVKDLKITDSAAKEDVADGGPTEDDTDGKLPPVPLHMHAPKMRNLEARNWGGRSHTPPSKAAYVRKPKPRKYPEGVTPPHMTKQCNAEEMKALAAKIKKCAQKLHIKMVDAAKMGGLSRCALNPCGAALAGFSVKERMEKLLAKLQSMIPDEQDTMPV